MSSNRKRAKPLERSKATVEIRNMTLNVDIICKNLHQRIPKWNMFVFGFHQRHSNNPIKLKPGLPRKRKKECIVALMSECMKKTKAKSKAYPMSFAFPHGLSMKSE